MSPVVPHVPQAARTGLVALLTAILVAAAPALCQGRETSGTADTDAEQPDAPGLGGTIHPLLAARLADLADGQLLAVYFELQPMPLDRWLPAAQRLPLAERRRQTIARLQEHADRTQAPLLAALAAARSSGAAAAPRANWLGNFVQVEATAATIADIAALPGVLGARLDWRPSLAEVVDGAVAPIDVTGELTAERMAGAAAPPSPAPVQAPAGPAATAALPPPAPGDGPVSVAAFVPWSLGFEGQGVVIANLDAGLGQHNDLDNRRWQNPGEVPNNGIDDDNNGFVDDVFGWAFDTASNRLDDGGGHGTQTAGVLVADGSCSGIALGMAPRAALVTCKVLSETDHWNALQYVLTLPVDVQSSSLSFKASAPIPPNYRMHRAVAANTLAAGLIRVHSAGNDGAACAAPGNAVRRPLNVSAPACVPAPYRDPAQVVGGALGGVLAVGAMDIGTQQLEPSSPCGPFAWWLADVMVNLPGFAAGSWDPAHDDHPWQGGAQQGLLKPDLAGPSRTTTTSAGPCATVQFGGTSNAAPAVAGVIALWKCANPSLGPEDMAMIAHQTAADRGAVAGKENDWGAGRIDAPAGLHRALCVQRVDHAAAWEVEHPVSAALTVAIDAVPGSLCALAIGLGRSPVPVGPVTVSLGPVFTTLAVAVTDAQGDFSHTTPLAPGLLGNVLYAQSFVVDQTWTNRILDSNVTAIRFVP